MRNFDFSSWQAVLTTLIGLSLITLIGVGVRLLLMQTVQQRRERENRQINERLRTLIAAYRILGGSFTGELTVDPTHLRSLGQTAGRAGGDRSRRIRDAVEAALSDIILLGTEEQVRLAARAATDLAEGRPVHTADLVISLRDFIRGVLSLDPVPPGLVIPKQGPTRPSRGGKGEGGDSSGDKGSSGKNAGNALSGAGMGAGIGLGMGGGHGRFGETEDTHE